MRRSIDKLMRLLSGEFDFEEPIYEFGALQAPGQQGRACLRKYFSGKLYVAADMRAGPGVDRILNLHKIDLPDESVGTVILLDVLEHVEFCREAVSEIHRVLKRGGVAIIASVMYFPIHNHPSDYWRFTPAGFKSLLEPFKKTIVETVGLKDFPVTVLALAFKSGMSDARMKALQGVILRWKSGIGNSYQEFFTMITPPFLLVPLYRLYRLIEARLHPEA